MLVGGVLFVGSYPRMAWAQGQIGSNDDCRSLRVTPANAKTDYPVDLAVVVVVIANQASCDAIVENIGTQTLRCMSPTDGTPTATTGYPLMPGKSITLGLASQRGFQCIRDATATAAGLVTVLQIFP